MTSSAQINLGRNETAARRTNRIRRSPGARLDRAIRRILDYVDLESENGTMTSVLRSGCVGIKRKKVSR